MAGYFRCRNFHGRKVGGRGEVGGGATWSEQTSNRFNTLKITHRGAKHCSLLKNLNLRTHIKGGLRRRGGNISVDLSLFVLLYNLNFMKKETSVIFFKPKPKKRN